MQLTEEWGHMVEFLWFSYNWWWYNCSFLVYLSYIHTRPFEWYILMIKYDLGQKYYAPQDRPDQGSNSWPPDHDSTFHVTETPALTTWPSVTLIPVLILNHHLKTTMAVWVGVLTSVVLLLRLDQKFASLYLNNTGWNEGTTFEWC